MALITDLTWEQYGNALAEVVNNPAVIMQGSQGNFTGIDIGILIGSTVAINGSSDGVIKAINKLLEAGRLAQETANKHVAANERLTSFRPPIESAAVNGYVPVTRQLISRSELASATKIIGSNT